MDESKFRLFKDEIVELVQTDQKFNELRLSIGRLVSHVESEQKMQVEHGKQIAALEEEVVGTQKDEGLRGKVKTITEVFAERKRINNAILLCVLGLVIERAFSFILPILNHKP